MESAEQVLERLFPLKAVGPVSMSDLAKQRAVIASAMPVDTSVEITTFMNSATVTVRLPQVKEPIMRTCIIENGFA